MWKSGVCHVDVEWDIQSKMSNGNQISAPNSENSSNEPFLKEHKQSQWKHFIHLGCVILWLLQLLVFWATGKAMQSGTTPDTSVFWFYVKQLQSDCLLTAGISIFAMIHETLQFLLRAFRQTI